MHQACLVALSAKLIKAIIAGQPFSLNALLSAVRSKYLSATLPVWRQKRVSDRYLNVSKCNRQGMGYYGAGVGAMIAL